MALPEVTAASFVQAFPEFLPAYEREPAMIEAALEMGRLHCDPQVFRSAYNMAVMLQAAHQLALSPFGENLRTAQDGSSLYLERWKQLSNSRRPRVMLGGGFPGGY